MGVINAGALLIAFLVLSGVGAGIVSLLLDRMGYRELAEGGFYIILVVILVFLLTWRWMVVGNARNKCQLEVFAQYPTSTIAQGTNFDDYATGLVTCDEQNQFWKL